LNPKIHNLSLKGDSGILLGGLSVIYIFLIHYSLNDFTSSNGTLAALPISFFEILLVVISFLFILISYLSILLINQKKRKKLNLKGWDLNANRIRKIYMIHLIFGGIILFFLMSQSLIKLIIPVSLLLYGFSSIFVNKYSLGKTNYLGVVFLANGFLSILLPNQSFLLWSLAFGGYHIIYGVFYFKRR